MRTSISTVALLLSHALGSGCAPAPVGLAVNIKVSPVWDDRIDNVQLLFCGGRPEDCTCLNLEDGPGVPLLDGNACADYGTVGPPMTVTCIKSQYDIGQEPGPEGEVIYVPVGQHTMMAYGLDLGGVEVAHDCASFTISEDELTEVTLEL